MSNFENTPKTFSEMWTYARTGPSIYVPNIDGLLIEYPENVPPLNHKGLLLEHSATNLLLHSRDFTNAAWSTLYAITRTRDAVGVDGSTATATTITDTDASYASSISQQVTIPATNSPIVASCFFRKTETAKFPAINLSTTSNTSRFVLNTMTGTAVEMTGAGTCAVDDFGEFWRASITLQNTTLSAVATLFIYPAINDDGGVSQVSSATGSCIIDFAQIEFDRSTASSPIATTTATVTRPSGSAVNAAFSTWGRQQAFTLFVHVENYKINGQFGGDIAALFKTGTNRILITGDTSSGSRFALQTAMASSSNVTSYFTATSTAKIAISSGGGTAGRTIACAVNGASDSYEVAGTQYTDITSLGIGRGQSTSYAPESLTIKRLEFWPTALTAAELQALTTL